MIIIGINGKSGAGKSTLAKMLLEGEENVKIIHLDHILDKIKSILSKNIVDTYFQNDGEEMKCLNKNTIFYKIINFKLINEVYNKIRIKYIKRLIRSEIDEARERNISYLIIESADLDKYIDFSELDIKVYVTSTSEIRRKRVSLGERNSKYGLNEEYFSNDVKGSIYSGDYDFIVENTEDIDHLKDEADDIKSVITKYQTFKRERKI